MNAQKQYKRKYSFFFHYNKPASRAAGRNKLTLHWRGKCHLVDAINCHVPIESVDKKTQPHCILKGVALSVLLVGEGKDGQSVQKTTAYIS